MAKVLNSDIFINFFINAQKVSLFSHRYSRDKIFIFGIELN